MLKKNEEYIVDIIDNGYNGEGIAKIDNFTIFIEKAIKGEKVKIKILKVQSDLCFAKILEIIESSKLRIKTNCETYTKCGGCDLRHIEYQETLKIKKAIVKNCLYKMLKKQINVEDTIGMENPLYYRNKLQYPVSIDVAKKPIMGVYSKRSHNVINTDKCLIQNELCQEIAKDIFKFIEKNNIEPYNEKTLKGTIRHIIIRIGVKTNEVLVTLVLNENKLKKEAELVDNLTSKYNQIKSIVKNYNNKNTNVILGKKNKIIYGNGYIYDTLEEYKFKISPMSFYQVNPIQTEVLYNTAINYLKEDSSLIKGDSALDLYCGIGTIGIWASKYFNKVYGIEIVEDAIKDAKENAKINNVNNIEFYVGDVEKILPKIIEKEKIKPNIVFVDPPRKGLDNNTIETLLSLETEKIIYISCNPATLARDLSKLQEKYKIEKVQPVDMFPWTSSIENVCLLKLSK